MNTTELNQKIANMEAELASMKALVNKPKTVVNYWQPDVSKSEEYYYVNYLGDVESLYAIDTSIKRYRVFKTEAEAGKYAEYIKAEETLRKAIAEANEGWLPNWSDTKETKYLVMYKNSYKQQNLAVEPYCYSKISPNFMYIRDFYIALELVKKYEKEFVTYLSY